MGQPVHMFLEDFDSGPDAAVLAATGGGWEPSISPAQAAPPISAQVDEAYAKGLEAGIAEGWAMREGDIEKARIDAEAHFQAELTGCASAVLAELSTGLSQHLEALHDRLANQLFDLLAPLLTRVLTENAIRDIVAEIDGLVLSRDVLAIELSGPPQLVERVFQLHVERQKSASAPLLGDIRISHSASAEVRLVCGETVIETRLKEWIGRITEAFC